MLGDGLQRDLDFSGTRFQKGDLASQRNQFFNEFVFGQGKVSFRGWSRSAWRTDLKHPFALAAANRLSRESHQKFMQVSCWKRIISAYSLQREEPSYSLEASTMQRPANSPLCPKAAHALDLFFATEAGGMNAYAIRRSRETQFAHLYALSDGALAAMGLRRDTLARWLFADLFKE
ncbi:hypothetical protein ACSBLW_05870 [Thioclava sp. FR2]|uniref:hypothetical protein n=1 Tax=Thioclava sp. FR2 TaxID=3445780 RepID=UPI003EBED222